MVVSFLESGLSWAAWGPWWPGRGDVPCLSSRPPRRCAISQPPLWWGWKGCPHHTYWWKTRSGEGWYHWCQPGSLSFSRKQTPSRRPLKGTIVSPLYRNNLLTLEHASASSREPEPVSSTSESESGSRSVLFDSAWSHGLGSARLLCPWDFPGKNTGVESRCLLQGVSPTQESNWGLLHCRWILYQLTYHGVKLQPAPRLLLLAILQFCHLPVPLPPLSVTLLACSAPYTSCCTVLLYFSGYCMIKMFSLFWGVFLCISCIKGIVHLL